MAGSGMRGWWYALGLTASCGVWTVGAMLLMPDKFKARHAPPTSIVQQPQPPPSTPAQLRASGQGQAMPAGWPDWGEPPQDAHDAAETWPQLPQAAGWAQFVGQDAPDLLLAGHGLLLLCSQAGGKLTALSLGSGSQLWETTLPNFQNWADLPCYSTASALYLPVGYNTPSVATLALDPATGQQLWTAPGTLLLAAGSAGVWVCRFDKPQWDNNHSELKLGQYLELLDPATGKALQSFKLGQLEGYAAQIPADGQSMAVASDTELIVAHSDGSLERAPRPHTGWVALLALDGSGLLDVGCAPKPSDAELAAAAKQQSGGSLPLDHVLGDVEARLYALPGLKPQWTAKWDDWELRSIGSRGLQLGDKAIAVCGGHDLKAINRATGKLRTVVPFNVDSNRSMAYPLAGQIFVQGETGVPYRQDAAAPYKPGFIDVATLLKVDAPDGLRSWPPVRFGDGCLCYLASSQPVQQSGAQGPQSTALVCVQLDASLHAKPGTLARLSPPQQFPQLVTAFYASADPLKNAALMAQAVAAGQRGLNQLCQAADAGHPQQLDALVRLTAYLEAKRQQNNYSLPRTVLLPALQRLGRAIAPQLSQWVDDPQLQALDAATSLHSELAALLMETGGAEALAYAQRTCPVPTLAPLTPAKPPFNIVPPQHTQGNGLHAGAWSEAKGPDGVRYVALTLPGPATDADIFIGIDRDGDGAFDVLLPTGLSEGPAPDVAQAPGKPIARSSGLQLTLNLPTLALTYYSGAGHFGFGRMPGTPSKSVTAKFTLTQLEQDSDADGLTDITERLLGTDPHKADTDGDGIADAADPAPLVDGAKMGALERGVARALAFQFKAARPAQPAGPQPPLRALFFTVQGCGPVAFAPPGEYGICRPFSGTPQLGAPGHEGVAPIVVMQVSVGPDESAPSSGRPAGQAAAWGVNISSGFGGSFVELKQIQGEYYPVRQYETWMS